jgi:hypothetical protein
MGVQLTTLLGRVQRLLGRDRPLAAGPATTGDPSQRAALAVRAGLPAAAQQAYDTWCSDRPEAATVLGRALATTGSVQAVAELAEAWDGWDPDVRLAVLDPVRRLARAGRQTDQTTCGSACLVMLAATGDPALAAWLADGWVPRAGGSALPTELVAAGPRRLAHLRDARPEDRFAVLQRVVKARTNAGPVPWPARYGTPPWGAARVARFPGVRYSHRMVDDTDVAAVRSVLARVAGAVVSGVAVPLYSGGDSARGWGTAVPRHVVLAVGARAGRLDVWQPSKGVVLTLAERDVVAADGRPQAALGGWGHLSWAVLPELVA